MRSFATGSVISRFRDIYYICTHFETDPLTHRPADFLERRWSPQNGSTGGLGIFIGHPEWIYRGVGDLKNHEDEKTNEPQRRIQCASKEPSEVLAKLIEVLHSGLHILNKVR